MRLGAFRDRSAGRQETRNLSLRLIAATLVALALARVYELWLLPVITGLGTAELFKPLVLWGNDGLMVVFFLLVGV